MNKMMMMMSEMMKVIEMSRHDDDDSYHIVDHYTDYVTRDEGSPSVDPWYQ